MKPAPLTPPLVEAFELVFTWARALTRASEENDPKRMEAAMKELIVHGCVALSIMDPAAVIAAAEKIKAHREGRS